MDFRCPNCHQGIVVEAQQLSADDKTIHSLTCPSCNSLFDFGGDAEATTVAVLGERIEHFELRGLLGEGTFGSVFKAWDHKLERFVALKVPRAGTLSVGADRKFFKEAQLAAGISHPNVVAVHEIGQFHDLWYIATQLIDGVSLRELLKSKTLDPRAAAELVILLLRGMQAFHDKGIIHRDLKPGNILIDTSGNPYIADFGLARRQTGPDVTVTQSGQVVGTILYMSPEQARGEVGDLTNSSDVYSMGVILYELLSGKRPFESTESRTVLYRIITEEPTDLRKYKKSLPRDLETICMKALQKEPLKRYATATEMADDLQRFLDGKPIQARPVSAFEKLTKLIRRNPLISTVVAVSAIAIGISVTFAMTRKPVGVVPVLISAGDDDVPLRFERFDQVLRVPSPGSSTVMGSSGSVVYLQPGLYRVSGNDSTGRFHEVWRMVPELPTSARGDYRFPHRAWEVEDGTVLLQPFRLFADDEIEDSIVLVKGGTFEVGSGARALDMDGRHSQSVSSLKIGVNEVSYGSFRRVMNQPLKGGIVPSTYLAEFTRQYNDRSKIPDDMPVCGYPVDVAIVYCELAGGRLPTCIEWEYVATVGGTQKYSTGGQPPIARSEELEILAVNAATPDTTPEGIRNLCSSVAEFTDSRCLNYSMLFPQYFPGQATAKTSREDLMRYPELTEVRGAPMDWVLNGSTTMIVNPRERVVAPFLIIDTDAEFACGRIGWRVVRPGS